VRWLAAGKERGKAHRPAGAAGGQGRRWPCRMRARPRHHPGRGRDLAPWPAAEPDPV